MACPCCVSTDTRVYVNDKDITEMLNAVSVDTAPDVIREPLSSNCWPISGEWMTLFGPGKTSVQMTAYPFGGGNSFQPNLNLTCATSVSVSVPWKMVYDCRLSSNCVDKNGQIGTKKGRWVMIPLKKRTITVTGDISGSSAFVADGCTVPAPKFSIQAGPQRYFTPQETLQYSHLVYKGNPFEIDTDDLDSPYTISIVSAAGCGGLPSMEAYLTGLNFSFTPPSQSSVTLTFDTPFTVCPGTCK
jgi:hypothetical protein